jgi:hypothetical protein
VRITSYPSLTETQFLGCLSAFVDSLFGELNSAAMYVSKLDGEAKGAAFAYEMSLDHHRYGALIVLDRWAALVQDFGRYLNLNRFQGVVEQAPARVCAAEDVLGRVNQVLDATPHYTGEIVHACILAFQSLNTTFQEERRAAEESLRLGPLLSEDFKQARRIFLEDLAVR